MVSWLFGSDEAGELMLRRDPHPALVIGLIAAAAGFAMWLYGRQTQLTPVRRTALGGLRALVYAALVLILFEPVLVTTHTVTLPTSILVMLDTSESMTIDKERRKDADIEDAALALGKLPFPQAGAQTAEKPRLSAEEREKAAQAARIDIAKGILKLPELAKLVAPDEAEGVRVRNFTFGEKLEAADSKPDWADAVAAKDKSTRLGDAIREAADRYAGQSVAGVVLLTDGGSNAGEDPLEVARKLKERSVPLHIVGIGVTEPDDVKIGAVLVADTAFVKDRVSMKVQVDSRGFDGKAVELTALLDGRPVARKPVELIGGTQFEELSFIAEGKGGTSKLEVTVSSLPGEAGTENNTAERAIRIIDEKIKVLYVEGKPRWEYRYLRAVLLRDHRLDVKFLLTDGDRDLARADPDRYLARFPDEASTAFKFDLVIVGDVPATFFTAAQEARIDELVREHGGSFLMLGGRNYAPHTYRDSPLAALLPVKVGPGGREALDPTIHPVVTEAGGRSLMTHLDDSPERTAELWATVRPLYDVPRLDGAKPGATVLAALSDSARRAEPYPLIAWQRAGTGKSLYVATDQLWRLRFKRGDEHHARFWGQAIRFLTLSRLLGENKRIRLEVDRRDGKVGERIRLAANVLNESYEPVKADSYTVFVQCPGEAEPRAVKLEPLPDSPGLYQGLFTPDRDGAHVVKSGPADAAFSNSVDLNVVPVARELLDRAMQEATLRKMAELSGGKYYTVRDLPSLPAALESKPRTMTVTREETVWDRWGVLAVLLGCVGLEWFLRRRYDVS